VSSSENGNPIVRADNRTRRRCLLEEEGRLVCDIPRQGAIRRRRSDEPVQRSEPRCECLLASLNPIQQQSDSIQGTDLTSGHRLYLPLLHCPHAQQLCPGSIDTLSPTCTFLTSLPMAMTIPLDSWPRTMSLSTT
jgi:hypothetical protein